MTEPAGWLRSILSFRERMSIEMTTLSGARMDGMLGVVDSANCQQRKRRFVRIRMNTSTKSLAELTWMAQVLESEARSSMF